MSTRHRSDENAHLLIRSNIQAMGGSEKVSDMLDRFRDMMAGLAMPRAIVLFALAEQVNADPIAKEAVLTFLEASIDHFDCFFEDSPETENQKRN